MKYYIIAGEASGDLHGANLMRGLYAEDPGADIRFWGGDCMNGVFREHQAGEGLVRHYKDGAVMGFLEVVLKARTLSRNIASCKADIDSWHPDVVILIDYPGFNFKIAKFAHGKGYKVFYYIAPKVWASRERRVKKLKAWVDQLFIVFPFEKEYFERKGVSYIYRGNPLIDAIDSHPALSESRSDFFARVGLEDRPFVAILPGSRGMELSFMLPRLTAIMEKMHSMPEYASWQFLIAGAPARTMEDYSKYLVGHESYVKVLFGETYGILRHAKAAVINSGTASLEAALIGTPQVVGYGSNIRLSFEIAKRIVRVKYISLGNLILDRLAFREILQNDFNTENIVAELRRLLEDETYRTRMLTDYSEIRTLLGTTGASAAVAKAMIEELRKYE